MTAESPRLAAAGARVPVILPRPWQWIARAEGKVAVEHPALDVRAVEVLVSVALSRGGVSVLATASPVRALSFASSFLELRGARRVAAPKLRGWRCGSTVLWVAAVRSFPLTETPARVHRVLVTDAERFAANPADEIPVVAAAPDISVVSGVLAEPDQWSYAFGRSRGVRLVRIPLRAVLKAFPDQRGRGLQPSDPRYERHMLVKDVPIAVKDLPGFAAARLVVRTDKPPALLDKQQRAVAEAKLGSGWESAGTGGPIVPLHLTPFQLAYLDAKARGVAQGKRFHLVLKARRGGITTVEQAISYERCVNRPNSHVATIAHTSDAVRRICDIIELYRQRDPEPVPVVGDSREEIQFANGSKFFIGSALSKGFGRGSTLQRVHGSEVAWWMAGPRNASEMDRYVAGIGEAASHGEIVFETTANGREWFANAYRDAKTGRTRWNPIFLPWFLDPMNRAVPGSFFPEEIRDTLTDEEKDLTSRHKLDLGQIAFRRAKQRDVGALFPQEYPEDDESCFLTSGTCFFDVPRILWLLKHLDASPLRTLSVPGGELIVWEDPTPQAEYVMGVDTSAGLPGGDRAGFGLVRRDTGAQVASLHGAIRPDSLAQLVVQWAKRYNDALTGVEREGMGAAVIQEIERLGHGASHVRGGWLFWAGSSEGASRPGWSTNSATRPRMLDALRLDLEPGGLVVRDRMLLEECLTFRLQGDGRFAADPGAHDDAVMKWAIASMMLRAERATPSIVVIPHRAG